MDGRKRGRDEFANGSFKKSRPGYTPYGLGFIPCLNCVFICTNMFIVAWYMCFLKLHYLLGFACEAAV